MIKQTIIKIISGLVFILCIIVQGRTYFVLDRYKPFMFIWFLLGTIAIVILFKFLRLKYQNKIVAFNITTLIIAAYSLFVFCFFVSFGGNADMLKTGEYAIVNHGTIVKYISNNEYKLLKLYDTLSTSANLMIISWGWLHISYCKK